MHARNCPYITASFRHTKEKKYIMHAQANVATALKTMTIKGTRFSQ